MNPKRKEDLDQFKDIIRKLRVFEHVCQCGKTKTLTFKQQNKRKKKEAEEVKIEVVTGSGVKSFTIVPKFKSESCLEGQACSWQERQERTYLNILKI